MSKSKLSSETTIKEHPDSLDQARAELTTPDPSVAEANELLEKNALESIAPETSTPATPTSFPAEDLESIKNDALDTVIDNLNHRGVRVALANLGVVIPHTSGSLEVLRILKANRARLPAKVIHDLGGDRKFRLAMGAV